MDIRQVYVQGMQDVENALRNMKQENARAKRYSVRTAKALTMHGFMSAQPVYKLRNKEKHYGVTYPITIHRDGNAAWNTTE